MMHNETNIFTDFICGVLVLLNEKHFHTECLAILYIIYTYINKNVVFQISEKFSNIEIDSVKSEFVKSISKVALYDLLYVISRFIAKDVGNIPKENYAHEKKFNISTLTNILRIFSDSDEDISYNIRETEYDFRNGIRAFNAKYHYDKPCKQVEVIVKERKAIGIFRKTGTFLFAYDKNVLYGDLRYVMGMLTLSESPSKYFNKEIELYEITYGYHAYTRDYHARIEDYESFSSFRFDLNHW